MDLYFLNKNLELVGIIDTANSTQWLERYFEVGTFEVYVQNNDEILDIVNQSYFVTRNDSSYVGVIEHFENEDEVDTGNFLIVQGQMAESLIGRRIIRNITYLKGTLFYVCNELLQKNLLNPVLQAGETISPRKMSCFNTVVRNELKNNPIIEIQASYENNLLEFLVDLLKSNNASIRVELADNGKFDIVIYDGTDRSYEQEENPYIVFSREYENLLSSTYSFDSKNEKNALYVGGEDNETTDEGRYIDKYELPVGNGVVSDIDRIESYVNASDLKQTWSEEQADGTKVEYTLTTDEYRKLLRARGKDNVVEPSEEMIGNVDITMYIFNQDYFLGDIVTIYNEVQAMYTNKRLIGMDRVDDENGSALEPLYDDVVILPTEEVSAANYLLTEDNSALLTEDGNNILLETASEEEVVSYNTRAVTIGNRKISELDEVEELQDGCCIPVVSNGETKKIYYGNLEAGLLAKVTSDKQYVHNQKTSAEVWEINHNLNKYPAVTVVDSAGSKVVGECDYIDLNNVRLTFKGAFSGKAYLG